MIPKLTHLLGLGNLIACSLGVLPARSAASAPTDRPNSIVPLERLSQSGRVGLKVSRTVLAANERSEEMAFAVSLRLRNAVELQTRLTHGEVITPSEMAARYYPLATDYEHVRAWLTAAGLTVGKADVSRLSVFATGPVRLIGQLSESNSAG